MMAQVEEKKPDKISRVAKQHIEIPAGVTVSIDGQAVSVKGPKGELMQVIHGAVEATLTDQILSCLPRQNIDGANMQAGTARANCANMVHGVSHGFEKKLVMIGVGYRAQLQGKKLVLSVGKSHPDEYHLPEGISAESPSQTEIIIRGIDKQLVGQVAAEIRRFRPPEPYKGKGIRYVDEYVVRKEAKK